MVCLGVTVGVLVLELPFFDVTIDDDESTVLAEFDNAGVISTFAHFAFALDFTPAQWLPLSKDCLRW